MFKRSLIVPLIGTIAMLAASVHAQILFEDGLNSGANWTVLQPTDTRVTFGYNYASDAIPQAPNGTDRIGLKMEANLTAAVGRELAVVPTNFTPSGNYRVSVDIWGNYSTTGTGTTEFMGGFVGHDGVTAGVNGGGLIYTADGGALQDIRLYRAVAGTPAQELWIGTRGGTRTPSQQYNRDITTDPVSGTPICDPEVPVPAGSSTYPDCRDSNFGPFYQSKFPGLLGVDLVLDPPGGQGPTQIDPQDAGTLGFQWNTLQIDVFPTSPGPVGATPDLGYATVKLLAHGEPLNPPQPPTEVLIGTIDNSAGVGPLVDFTRKPALVYADLFSSVASEPQFNFGIFDNFKVERLAGGVTGDFNNDGQWNCLGVARK